MSDAADLATLGACRVYAQSRLPRFEADLLTCRAARVPRAHLYAFAERPVTSDRARELGSLVRRRVAGEPVAYILGERGFWGLDLSVTPSAMIPRADTETLVAVALPLIRPDARVLDLGTGCGAVALAIAAERPRAAVTASDIDAACVALCARNAARHNLQVAVRVANGFAGLTDRFDVIVSNPPYVAIGDPHLDAGDPRFEPALALIGGATGLEFLARLIAAAPARLRRGGWLAVEHGHEQGGETASMLATAGFASIRNYRDIERRPRVTAGRWP